MEGNILRMYHGLTIVAISQIIFLLFLLPVGSASCIKLMEPPNPSTTSFLFFPWHHGTQAATSCRKPCSCHIPVRAWSRRSHPKKREPSPFAPAPAYPKPLVHSHTNQPFRYLFPQEPIVA